MRTLVTFAPRPDYPYDARALHHTGRGVFVLSVEKDGTVKSVKVVKSIGYPELDDAAVRCLRQWLFKPNAVTQVKIPMSYTMSGVKY